MTARRALAISVVACFAAAVLGNVAVGDALTGWYAGLRQPAFGLPLAGWLVVGVLYYLLMGVVLYRVLRRVEPADGRGRLVALAFAVLLGNELWNAAFFGLRSPFWGFVGLTVFLVPLLGLWAAVRRRDVLGGRLLLVYVLWVVLYDLPWAFALWRLNP